jgi:hypothetical protein
MAVFHSRAGVAGSAVLAACLLAGGAGSAFAAAPPAAPHHSPTVRVPHATKPRPVDKLAGPRKGATHALAADAARLSRITAAAAASTVIGAADQAALATAQAADLTTLRTDGQAIAAASTMKSLRAVTLSAARTVQGAQLQLQLVTAADRIENTAVALTASGAALTPQTDTLQAAGTDTSTVTTPLADLAAQVGTANTSAQNAATEAFSLPAAPSVGQIHTVDTTARGALDAAYTALHTGAQDVATATTALATLTGTPAPVQDAADENN